LALVAAAGLKFATFAVFLFREFRSFANAGPLTQGLPQIRYAMALWIPAILNGAIGGQAHQYIVGHYFTPSEYAIYAVACFQVPFVAILTNSISEVLLVRATEYVNQGRRQDLYALWINACRKGLLLYIAISTVLMVLAQPIIVTLFTDRYRSSAPLFAIMVLGFLSYGVFQDALFRACSAMRIYGLFYGLRAILSVGLAFAGLKLWGVWGIALSTVVAVGLINFLQLVPAAKLLQVPFTHVLPWKDAGKMLIAAVVAGFAVTVLEHNVSRQISLILGFSLFAAVYGTLVLKLGVIRSNEILSVLREAQTSFVPSKFRRWRAGVSPAAISSGSATS
jgi:O-antigen/teichoic acid export membrane protein